VRVITHIKRLDDCFGDFLVRVSCPCGASRHIEPEALARIAGWAMTLAHLVTRMRCSQCGKKVAEVVVMACPTREWLPDATGSGKRLTDGAAPPRLVGWRFQCVSSDGRCVRRCDSDDRRRAFADPCNRLAEFDSFLNVDRPKFIAWHAVSLDRIAAVEQSHQVRDRKRVLWLFALAARACRYEDNGLSHGAIPS
jgi:hypothetical protein